MTDPLDIILKLMDTSADHCAVIKMAWDQDIENFWVGLDLAISPTRTFGIDKVPALDPSDEEPGTLTFNKFYHLAMSLSHGDLTGDAAKEAVENAAMTANALEWNLWYRRILLKSLHKYIPIDVIQKELIRLTTE